MSSGNQLEHIFRLQATVSKLVIEGKRDPEKVANILQAIINGSFHAPASLSERHTPRFRGYKNIGGDVVADMRSDAEIEEDANRVFDK